MIATFFDNTGKITRVNEFANPDELTANTPPGQSYILENSDPKTDHVVNGVIVKRPVVPESTSDRQARLRAEINDERDRRNRMTIDVSVPGVGLIPVKLSPKDRAALSDLGFMATMLLIARDLTTKIPYRDAKNVTHALSAEQMAAMYEGAVNSTISVYKAAWRIKDSATIPENYKSDSLWI